MSYSFPIYGILSTDLPSTVNLKYCIFIFITPTLTQFTYVIIWFDLSHMQYLPLYDSDIFCFCVSHFTGRRWIYPGSLPFPSFFQSYMLLDIRWFQKVKGECIYYFSCHLTFDLSEINPNCYFTSGWVPAKALILGFVHPVFSPSCCPNTHVM